MDTDTPHLLFSANSAFSAVMLGKLLVVSSLKPNRAYFISLPLFAFIAFGGKKGAYKPLNYDLWLKRNYYAELIIKPF
jgi:hypothetical protein